FRGTAYALRAGASKARELRAIDTAFALSSILTPFALGAAIGGIASRRVPVGNAAGDQFSSWLNPTSLLIGVLAVVTAPYLAAVAAIIAGWALAQSPVFLEGLTVRDAAAGRDSLVAVTVAVLAGAAILFPSLALLFRLVLGGDLGRGESAAGRPTQPRSLIATLAPGLLPRLAIACLVAGIGFTTIANAAWAHTIGVFSL